MVNWPPAVSHLPAAHRPDRNPPGRRVGRGNYLQQRPGFFAAANPESLAGQDLDPEVLKNTPIWATIGINDEANRLE